MSSSDSSESMTTCAVSSGRLTSAETPSKLLSLFSIRAEQDAQVIPVLSRSTSRGITSSLFRPHRHRRGWTTTLHPSLRCYSPAYRLRCCSRLSQLHHSHHL